VIGFPARPQTVFANRAKPDETDFLLHWRRFFDQLSLTPAPARQILPAVFRSRCYAIAGNKRRMPTDRAGMRHPKTIRISHDAISAHKPSGDRNHSDRASHWQFPVQFQRSASIESRLPKTL
jgi:hypothetical protein